MKRQVFFSFHYSEDVWRVGQVRNMGIVESQRLFSDNGWEKVRLKSESAIKAWIDSEMKMRSCVVVLIGNKTASRKWVQYEIEQAWKLGKGIVGIYIHNLATVYKGNIIKNLIMDCQSYTKYRPNETTGGIFVSWRRKEELPTGA